MKFISLSTKLNIAVSAVSLVSIFIGFVVLFNYLQDIKTDVYTQTQNSLIQSANEKIAAKMRIGITNAISIANDARIKKALKTGKREEAIESLKDISATMKAYTNFHNIKIHLHTKENISFLRNWKIDKYGDDLSSFRDSVVAVNKTHKPITTFEAGRAGLLLRAIIPVTDSNNTYLGSLEFIQGINSIAKSFDEQKVGFLLLMKQKVQSSITKRDDFAFNKNQKFQDYIISQKYLNKDFLADAQHLDMMKLFQNGYLVSKNYFYTFIKIKDFQDKNLGIALLAKPLSLVNSAISGAKTLIYMALLGIFGMMLVIAIVLMGAIRKLVISPLLTFEKSLDDFFLFLQGKKDYTDPIKIDTNDEFGEMAKSLEENIAVSAKLHEEINELNTNLEEKVVEKTQKVTTLLDNAGQGFLSFSCDLIIDEEYSKECIKLLGDDLAGKYIPDILFSQNETKQKFFQKTIIEACRIDVPLVQKSILSLLPNEIILNRRALKLSYKILENKKLMLIITNITAQKKLEKKIKKEQEVLKMIVEIVSESDSFYDAVRDYGLFVKNYRDYVNSSKTSLHNISDIYRVVHTFKGTFSQLYMSDVVKYLHALESKISKMLQSEHTNESLLALLDAEDMQKSFTNELNIIKDVLGKEFLNAQNILKINYADINTLQKKISTVFKKEDLHSSESEEILEHISSLSNQKFINLLRPYTSLVHQLAPKLEKEIYEFDIIGDGEMMVGEEYKPFVKSLLHMFRNSVDHGIEDQETRLLHDKDEIGTISCSFTSDDDKIQIIISDDGSGIDKEKVLLKAIEKNIVTQEDADKLSDKEIYELIFHQNLSTKEEVSDISGRGVGMNAVWVEVEKLGGFIEINSKKGLGTTFFINLPKMKENKDARE